MNDEILETVSEGAGTSELFVDPYEATTREVEKPSMKNTHAEIDAFITKHGVQDVNPGDTKRDKLQKISLHFGGVV